MQNFSANLAVLFPLASCLYIAIRLSDGQVDGKGGGWSRGLVYTTTAILTSLSIAGVLFRVGPISLIWLFVSGFLCALIWIKSRALNRSLLLHSLCAGSTNVARERMAADFVEHNSWFVAARASRFRALMGTGVKWPVAMEKAGIAKSISEIFASRCIADFGKDAHREVAPALDPLRIQAETERLLARLMILPWSAVGLVVIALVMILIVPTLQRMFDEFGLELPQSMSSFVVMSDLAVNTPLAAIVFLFCLLLLVIIFALVVIWLFPRLTLTFPVRWVAEPYFRGLGLVSLAMSIRRDSDFFQACNNAAKVLPIPHMSQRLKAAAGYHSQGMSPDTALARVQILKGREVELLANSVNSKSFSWAIEQVAISAIERMLRFYSIAIQLFLVMAVFFFAFLFGWLAVGIIECLSVMIESLAG